MSSDKHEFADFLSKEIKGYIDALSLRFRRHKKMPPMCQHQRP